jgi:hypothetical protein
LVIALTSAPMPTPAFGSLLAATTSAPAVLNTLKGSAAVIITPGPLPVNAMAAVPLAVA